MIPLFSEYHANHYRFSGHLHISLLLAMVAPLCAFLFYQQLDWWSPWLWGCSMTGVSLALCLYSVVQMVKKPQSLTPLGQSLIERSDDWFPFFFVVMQSLIYSLIILFVWFSITALALTVPLYVHAALVLWALLLPLRRYNWARMTAESPAKYAKTEDVLHGICHMLMSVFLARCLIGLTVMDVDSRTTPTVMWQIIVWIPAATYILYTAISTVYHLTMNKESDDGKTAPKKTSVEEPIDRF